MVLAPVKILFIIVAVVLLSNTVNEGTPPNYCLTRRGLVRIIDHVFT
ncbi:MAG: hypothetical protein WBI76_03725 [Dethiobacteria bacterium]|jgi:hypothetical protein